MYGVPTRGARCAGKATGSISCRGATMERAEARGKHLLLHFDRGLVLHSHLGMRGSWRISSGAPARDRRAWVVLSVPGAQAAELGGSRLDLRTDAELRSNPQLRSLGPDVLAQDFDAAAGVAALRGADQSRQIGEVLLDQRVLAGIGNIYKCEGCWSARVDPWRALSDLDDEDLRRLVIEIGGLMRYGVEMGRTPRSIYRRHGASAVPGVGRRSRRGARAMRTGRPTGAHRVREQTRPDAVHNRRREGGRMSPGESIDLLSRVPLFSELSREELERISRVSVARSFPAGVRVFHEGDNSDACYLVRTGDLRVTREHPDGRAIALATLGPGDIFGELAMLDGEARSASVETLTDAELLALPALDVRRLLADHPEISVKLIAALTRRLRETNERVARQSFQTVPSRVAGVLTQLIAEESASEGRHGITIRMTQADLAQLAGTSRESVSRFLATLERAGVVQVGRGRVTVVEPRRLRAYIF